MPQTFPANWPPSNLNAEMNHKASEAAFVGDLAYYDAVNHCLRSANTITDAGSGTTEANFASVFVGVFNSSQLSSDAVAHRAKVLIDQVWDFPCDSATFALGDYVAIAYSAGAVAQRVAKTTDPLKAIGRVIKEYTSATTRVKVRLTSKILAGIKNVSATGSGTFDSITGSDANLQVTGIAGAAGAGGIVSIAGGAGDTAAAGGAVTVTGGAGTTSGAGGALTMAAGAGGSSGNGGNASLAGGAGTGAGTAGTLTLTGGAAGATNVAGGAVTMTGGAGGGTGNGGAVAIAGGTSGSGGATGNGGAASLTGGASVATNGTGGEAKLIGGLGTGTGAGGAVTITSGAAGATGVAGAVNISVGAATAGNGSAMTLTAGNGAGGTASGGNLNLVPGTAVSTGTPGEFQIASTAGTVEAMWQQSTVAAVPVSGSHYVIFLARRAYRVKSCAVCCSSSSTVPTVDIKKDTGTTAPGSGTTVLTGVITFSGTANTVVAGTLVSTIATLTLAAGDRLTVSFAGTVGSIVNATVSVLLVPC